MLFVIDFSKALFIYIFGFCLVVKGIMDMPDLVIQALALTIHHFKQFGFERIVCLGASFRSLSCSMEMNLSANVLQQLEVVNKFLYCAKELVTIFLFIIPTTVSQVF